MMATVESTAAVTPERLLTIPEADRFELVDGQLAERNVSALSSWVGGVVVRILSNHCEKYNLGMVWPTDVGLRCFPDAPDKIRRPDVSFVSKQPLPEDCVNLSYLSVAPDQVVEVVSPNDLANAIDEKVNEFLRAGVRLIWIINPQLRTVRVHRANGSGGWLLENAELDGEDVLPGLRIPLRQLFPPA